MRITDEPTLPWRQSVAIWSVGTGTRAHATAGLGNPANLPEARRSKAGLCIECASRPAAVPLHRSTARTDQGAGIVHPKRVLLV